jgi:predicted MPP superfamily phosphohydrolase
MSLESAWPGVIAAIFLPALGHVYHFILAVNVSSGLGFRETTLARIRLALCAVFTGSACLLLGQHMADPWWNWGWPWQAYPILCVASGGLLWPLLSFNLNTRSRPAGVSGRSQRLDLRRECGANALIGRGKGNWLLRLPGNESLQLCLREYDVCLAGLPRELEGLSIIQLSDLHLAPAYDLAFFERVIDACREWRADLVLFTGDLIDSSLALSWITPVLQPLEARLGKFAILGNHDAEYDSERITVALEEAGFESLEGRWTTVMTSGRRLAVGGTSAPWGPAIDPVPPPADLRILLSHSPDLFYRARNWGVELMLSGHNHGGQIRLPAVGPVFMPSVYSRRFDRGFFRSGRTLLHVSEGIGGKHPVRYGCPPEVCRFVLRRTGIVG